MTVFVDSFYWIALLNGRDEHHQRVKSHAIGFRASMLTTQWVLIEVADAFAISTARASIKPFFQELAEKSTITILDATPAFLHQGLDLYHARPDKAWSLTDCCSFFAMKEYKLSDALTGDHHFSQAGFRPLFA